jgi:hypothetical protein
MDAEQSSRKVFVLRSIPTFGALRMILFQPGVGALLALVKRRVATSVTAIQSLVLILVRA